MTSNLSGQSVLPSGNGTGNEDTVITISGLPKASHVIIDSTQECYSKKKTKILLI